jgi:hypothetical protein
MSKGRPRSLKRCLLQVVLMGLHACSELPIPKYLSVGCVPETRVTRLLAGNPISLDLPALRLTFTKLREWSAGPWFVAVKDSGKKGRAEAMTTFLVR